MKPDVLIRWNHSLEKGHFQERNCLLEEGQNVTKLFLSSSCSGQENKPFSDNNKQNHQNDKMTKSDKKPFLTGGGRGPSAMTTTTAG